MLSLLDFFGRKNAIGNFVSFSSTSRLLILFICTALLCLQANEKAAYADVASAISTTDLTSLEKRLFVETYPSQSVDERLSRLEKFVFGSTRSGSASERLTSLLLAVPSLGNNQSGNVAGSASGSQAAQSVGGNSNLPNNGGNSSPDAGAANAAVASGDVSPISTDYYPTVTALEQKILGHADERAKLPQRISDMETKAFGKPDLSGDDLATRVDKLKQYVEKRYGDDYLTTPEPAVAANSSVPVDSLNITSQITLLEKTVFAKTYTRDGIISRLDRLEKAVYPEKPVNAFSSVRARVQRLMNSLEITNTAQAPSYSSPYSGESPDRHATTKHHHFWHKVGSILSTAATMAASSAMGSMSMGGYGGGGMGYPGGMMFGPGYGGMY